MKKEELEKLREVVFNNFFEYDSEKCNNGDSYVLWTAFSKVGDRWEISYGTTADFPYCDCCGCFGDHYDYENNCYTCGEFKYIKSEEVLERINSFKEDENNWIKIIQ